MSRNTFVLIGIMLVIGVLSAIIAMVRTASFATPEEIAAKGMAALRRERLIFYGIYMPLGVGIISFFVYRFMSARWPASVDTNFLLLAFGMAVLLSVMALAVFKGRAFVEFTLLHILYVAGFGWLMPRLFL